MTDRSWKRIAEDVRSTTGRSLVLHFDPRVDGWSDFDVFLDGKREGSFGHVFPTSEEECVNNNDVSGCRFRWTVPDDQRWTLMVGNPIQRRISCMRQRSGLRCRGGDGDSKHGIHD